MGEHILVDVSYEFHEDRQEFRALVKAYIPEEDGLLPEIFRNKEKYFWNSALTSEWGWSSDRDGYRYNVIELYDPDIDELRKQVNYYINNQIEQLRKVVHANILASASAKLPESKHYEFVI